MPPKSKKTNSNSKRRRSKTESKNEENKTTSTTKEEQLNNDNATTDEANETSRKKIKTLFLNSKSVICNLFAKCNLNHDGNSNNKSARISLEKAEESGAMELHLWPIFLHHQANQNDEELDIDWDKAAYLLALLVNQRLQTTGGTFGSGSASSGGILSFVTAAPAAETENEVNDETKRQNASKAFRTLLTHLLQYQPSSSSSSLQTNNKLYVETIKTRFLIAACNSCSKETNDIIRLPLLQMVSISLWSSSSPSNGGGDDASFCRMPQRYRELELKKSPVYRRRWSTYCTSTTSTSKQTNKDQKESIVLECYVPTLMKLYLTTLQEFDKSDDDESGIVQSQGLTFLHTTLQLLLDLLSTTNTRRYLRPYLLSIHLSVHSKLSTLYKSFFFKQQGNENNNSEKARLFVQLITMLQESETFGVHDVTAKPLSNRDLASLYHERAHILQKLSHRHYSHDGFGGNDGNDGNGTSNDNVLSELIYAGVGMVCEEDFLRRQLDRVLDLDVLSDLAHRLRLITIPDDEEEGEGLTREFITEVLVYHHVLQPSELQTLSQLPLYPEESLLWNPHLVPPGGNQKYLSASTSSTTLALPKLNLQFLTFGDYLQRNFKLMRLESAYEIRGDLVNVIKRMRPVPKNGYQDMELDMDDDDGVVDEEMIWKSRRGKVEFHGWARMGLELTDMRQKKRSKKNIMTYDTTCPVRILKVSPPKLGENIPSQVLAEVTIDLHRCGESIRKEWDTVGEFDNLFLVAIDGSAMEGGEAPLIEGKSGNPKNNNNSPRRVPDEEDVTFPRRFGIVAVRGCMVLEVRDEDGTVLSDPALHYQENEEASKPKGTKRIFRVALDPAQYAADATGSGSPLGTNVYKMLNVIVRRHGKENNFKAVLETVRGLMQGTGSVNRSIPSWLQPVILGYGDPSSASFTSSNMKTFARETPGVSPPDAPLNYGDTFLNEDHLRESFGNSKKIIVDGKELQSDQDNNDGTVVATRKQYQIKMSNDEVLASSYPFPENTSGNNVKFTPVQVKAIQSGLSSGLTLIVGPPGTGKTDVACQIIANLYHSFPTQRTVLVTHSNAALNDLFEKVMARGDVDERYMLRLGSGERDLETSSDFDFTKTGRVNHILARRGSMLEKVQCLSESLGISGTVERGPNGLPSYTCETAEYFKLHHIQKRMQMFNAAVTSGDSKDEAFVALNFPFKTYFELNESSGELKMTLEEAKDKFNIINDIFTELAEYRPLELLRSQRQRTDYLLTKQARIVAMTCTHAAIARSHLIDLGFQYDNLVMEEAGQMLDVETFVPLLLQKGESDSTTRLKRVCLIGDHHQLPPVVKNMSFSKYSNLDQSLFTRLIRLGVPTIDLNKQGRARAAIAKLYSWRYQDLGNLEHVNTSPVFSLANPGFVHPYQIINVEDFEGRGESTPTAYFYQNVGEAEYAVALFQYMCLLGYPPEKISILTTYNGQKDLLNDILSQRCGKGTPLANVRPGAVSTVDHYQGQQNDYVILSLVRTNAVGHLRDVRRLVVAVSRARYGLYVFCRQSVFGECHELRNTMDQLAAGPNKLELVTGEQYPGTRKLSDIPEGKKFVVDNVSALGSIVHSMQTSLCPDK